MGRRNGRQNGSAAAAAAALPAELLSRVMDLLSWRETSAMACTCSRWRSVVQTAAGARFEWRVTNLLAAAAVDEAPTTMQDAAERLERGHGGWADTVFAPSLVLLAARTADPRLFIKGAYWTRTVAAMERARLLPPRCLVIGTLSVIARGGEEDSEEEGDTIQVTAAHLPGTRLSTATFERKELRQSARAGGVDDPFAATGGREVGAAGGLLLFSVNAQSAWELAAAASRWGVEASEDAPAIAGAVFPHADCSNPLMLYQRDRLGESSDPSTRQQKPASKKKGGKENDVRRGGHHRQRLVFQKRRQYRKAPMADADAARGQVQFPSNLVVRLSGGRVRMRAWTASGLVPVTPIVRRSDPPAGGLDRHGIVYGHVEVHRHLPDPAGPLCQVTAAPRVDVGRVFLLKELVHARLDLSAGQALRIIASRDPDALERFFRSEAPTSVAPKTEDLEAIECGYSVEADALFSLGERRWENGMFGVVMGLGGDDWRHHEAQEASERALHECKARGGLPIGWLVASPTLFVSADLGVLPMAMATTDLAIGPSDGAAKVHQNATSGALLYYSRDR
jgi:hypothetical protein